MTPETFAQRFPEVVASLDAQELEALAAAFALHEANAGEALVAAGAPSSELFLVVDGSLDIRIGDRTLAPVEAGSIFGEVSLLDPGAAGASVVSDQGCTVLRLSRQGFDELASANPRAALALLRAVIRSLAGRHRGATALLGKEADLTVEGEDADALASLLEGGARLAREFRDVTRQVREKVQVGREHAAKEYDVVVIGGGPHGIAYATWLKQDRPETRVAIVEKRVTPGFKIGESTLGHVVRAALSMGVPLPVLRRLFNNKIGLHFWWMNEDDADLHMHVDHVIEETYQLERRVWELLMLNVARRAGIDVYQDTKVVIDESRIQGQPKELVCERGNGDMLRIQTKIVCDASGPAAVIGRHLGIRRKNTEFNTNAYFAYYNRSRLSDIPTWEQAATRHLCFPEGWVWFIELASWERASDDQLNALIDNLLDIGSQSDADYPTRMALAEQFNAALDQYPTSIGVVPRTDIDTAAELPFEERFNHYVDRYPAFRRIMDNYELIESPYEGHPTFFAYTDLVQSSDRYAGDGWLLVGDAAYFVNPLYSPGMTYGHSVASMAARETVGALERGDFSEEAFATHDQGVRRMYDALVTECEALYRAFRSVEAYERLFLLRVAYFSGLGAERILQFGGVQAMRAVRPMRPLGPQAELVANPRYVDLLKRAVDVMRDHERRGIDPSETGAALHAIVDPVIEEVADMEAVAALGIGTAFKYYNDRYERVPGKEPPWEPLVPAWVCQRCGSYTVSDFAECYVCGDPAPPGTKLAAPPAGLPAPPMPVSAGRP